MKKILVIITFLFLLVVVTACNNVTTTTGTTGTTGTTNNTATTNDGAITYKDGTYTGEGNKRTYGYEEAVVTITNGRISDIVLKRMKTDGTEVNYDEWTGVEVNGTLRPNLKQYRLDLAAQMLADQSPDEVDIIAGATDSSIGWMEAVSQALQLANQ